MIPYGHICKLYSVTKWARQNLRFGRILLFHEAHFNVDYSTSSEAKFEMERYSSGKIQLYYYYALRALDVLGRVRDLQCSDPRDKIFGLSGVLDPLNRLLPGSDYTKSVTDIFCNVTISLMRDTRSLEVLYFLPAFEPSRSPSWMVDWNLAPALPALGLLGLSVGHYGIFRSEPLVEHINYKLLKIKGKIFDHVRQVSKPRYGADETALLEHWKDMCRFGLSLPHYLTGEDLRAVLGMILRWDRVFNPGISVYDDYQQDFEQFHKLLTEGKTVQEIDDNSGGGKIATTLQRTDFVLCTSSKGFLVMVPKETREADKIVVLDDGPLPFVLRPVGEHYQIIGGCYGHGVWSEDVWADSGLKSEKIFICW